MAAPTEQEEFEMKTFFKGTTILKLESGKEIKIPKLNWGREGKVIRCLGQMLSKVPNLRKLADSDMVTGADLVAVLPDVLASAPEFVTEMASHLSGLKIQEVQELDTEDIVKIVYPFFPRIVRLLNTGNLGKLAQQATPVESPTS